MDSKPMPVYEDFEVHTEWVHEAVEDTFIAYLPGFTKDQLKVQVTSGGNLRISGERPIGGNKFSRFYKEIPIPSNCDRNKISANFKRGMLYIKHPKISQTSADVPTKADQNAAAGPQPPRPSPAADLPQKQSNGGPEQAVQEAPPPIATVEKQTGEKKTDGLAKEADTVSDKAAPDEEATPKPATIEKQTGEKTDGLAKEADNVSDKAAPDKEAPPVAAMEKQTGDEKTDGLAAAKEADNVSDKAALDKEAPPVAAMEKQIGDEKTDGLAAAKEADNASDKAAPDMENDDEMKDQSNAANGKREKLADDNDDKWQQGINMVWLKYKQVLDGLAMGLNPRKMMNMALAVLMIVVLSIYLRNAISSLSN